MGVSKLVVVVRQSATKPKNKAQANAKDNPTRK